MKGNAVRDIIIMVVSLLSIMLLVIPVSSSSTIVSIGSESVTVGQSVTLPLMVKGADEPISCASVILSYNSSVFKVTEDSVKEGDFDLFVPNVENGKIKIVCFQIVGEGLKGDFEIANITFKAIRKGYSKLDIEIQELNNTVGKSVQAVTKSGSLTAEEDEGVPKPTPTPTITPTTTPALPSPSPISPSPSLTPTPPIPSPSPMATTTPTLTPTPLIPVGSKVVVHIGNFSVAEGKSCNAAIIIKNIGESGLSRADIMLEYNPSVVKVESAGRSEFNKFACDVPSEGKLKMFALETGAKVKGNIKFAELKLRAIGKENESSELGLEIKRLKDANNHDVPFEVENGFLLIKPSKAIPALSMLEIIALVTGTYFIIRMRRRRK